jgi:hypothetical protein
VAGDAINAAFSPPLPSLVDTNKISIVINKTSGMKGDDTNFTLTVKGKGLN